MGLSLLHAGEESELAASNVRKAVSELGQVQHDDVSAIIQRLVVEGVEAAAHQGADKPKIRHLASFQDLEDSLTHVTRATQILESVVAFHNNMAAWAVYHGTEVATGAFTREVKTARAEAARM